MVLAGAPNSEAREVARPSPSMVRCRPGSSMKFSPTVELMAHMSPMCSTMVASAIGTMVVMAVISSAGSALPNRENMVFSNCTGRPIHAA